MLLGLQLSCLRTDTLEPLVVHRFILQKSLEYRSAHMELECHRSQLFIHEGFGISTFQERGFQASCVSISKEYYVHVSISGSLVFAGHLLYASPLASHSHEIVWHERDEHGALAGHVPGQAQPSLRHWLAYKHARFKIVKFKLKFQQSVYGS